MAKYEYDFKRRVVEAHLSGEGGKKSIAEKFGIPSPSTVLKWVKVYKGFGEDGLKRKRTQRTYTTNFKMDVLSYYHTSGKSYIDVAVEYGIPSPEAILQWKQSFNDKGIDGLTPKSKGRPSLSGKTKKQTVKKELAREQELERELELVRAELAFVKKLRAFGMPIPPTRSDTLESSTSSEKSSN